MIYQQICFEKKKKKKSNKQTRHTLLAQHLEVALIIKIKVPMDFMFL